ncbi:MAG: glycosyl hydrolase family 28-related protein [Opitutaceae bacterium]
MSPALVPNDPPISKRPLAGATPPRPFLNQLNQRSTSRLSGSLAVGAAAILAIAFALPVRAATTPGEEPGEDIIRAIPPLPFPQNDPQVALGYLNAKLPPYNAVGNGIADDTNALQTAAIAARDHQLVLFLPAGTYRVSNTTQGIMNSDPTGCNTQASEVHRSLPTRILGSRLGAGVTIRLADNASGFDNPDLPKPVLDFFALGREQVSPPTTPCTYNIVRLAGGSNYNHTLRHVRILIGSGNAGAVGVNMGTDQGGLLEDVRVEAVTGASFFAGAYDIPGQGGGAYNLDVTGGLYGVYITEGSRFPLLAGCRFTNQTLTAVSCRHSGPLVIAGCYFNEPLGVNGVEMFQSDPPLKPSVAKAVGVTIVDSVFALKNNAIAVLNNTVGDTNSVAKNVYLNSVYLASGVVAVQNGTAQWKPGGRTLINEYAYTNPGTGEQSATNLINGNLNKTEIKTFVPGPALPAYTTLQARHT